jgi:hypothetical protein
MVWSARRLYECHACGRQIRWPRLLPGRDQGRFNSRADRGYARIRGARENPAFRWVNILLGNLKTAIAGTFHSIRRYAPRDLAKFWLRFNRRARLANMLDRTDDVAALRAACATTMLFFSNGNCS